MSIENEILRIQHNVANAYAAVSEKGGEVPLQPTSANLAAAVKSIPTGGGGSIPGDVPLLVKTSAEYAALPDAEKKADVMYAITDDHPGGGSSGVASFNGRTGAVMPQQGDYTADMVGAATMEQVNAAISEAITGAIEESY